MKIEKIPFEVGAYEWTDMYVALNDPNLLNGCAPAYAAEVKKRRKELARKIIDQVHAYFVANTTKDDKDIVHIPYYDEKYLRLFTYTCPKCGACMTIESDSGHMAVDYWRENHACKTYPRTVSEVKVTTPK